MSLIKPMLWHEYMGEDVPMPENCTYDMFAAARAAMWNAEGVDDVHARIKQLVKLKKQSEYPELIDEFIRIELKGLGRELHR